MEILFILLALLLILIVGALAIGWLAGSLIIWIARQIITEIRKRD